jgi:hypothetical protein
MSILPALPLTPLSPYHLRRLAPLFTEKKLRQQYLHCLRELTPDFLRWDEREWIVVEIVFSNGEEDRSLAYREEEWTLGPIRRTKRGGRPKNRASSGDLLEDYTTTLHSMQALRKEIKTKSWEHTPWTAATAQQVLRDLPPSPLTVRSVKGDLQVFIDGREWISWDEFVQAQFNPAELAREFVAGANGLSVPTLFKRLAEARRHYRRTRSMRRAARRSFLAGRTTSLTVKTTP